MSRDVIGSEPRGVVRATQLIQFRTSGIALPRTLGTLIPLSLPGHAALMRQVNQQGIIVFLFVSHLPPLSGVVTSYVAGNKTRDAQHPRFKHPLTSSLELFL
jgi:hypothetical protein